MDCLLCHYNTANIGKDGDTPIFLALRARQPIITLRRQYDRHFHIWRAAAIRRARISWQFERANDAPRLGRIFRVTDGPRLDAGPVGTVRYPIPYSESFYADLVAYQNRLDDAKFGRQLAGQYMQNQVVVLIERASLAADTHEVALFSNLSLSALLKDTGMRLLPTAGGARSKSMAPLAFIYLMKRRVRWPLPRRSGRNYPNRMSTAASVLMPALCWCLIWPEGGRHCRYARQHSFKNGAG